jgi:ribosomal protein S18 acetylase RimI-like enzyme
VEIRLIRSEEYEEAGRVTALAYREFVPAGRRSRDWEAYLAEIADVAGRADRTQVLVAVDEGRILGSVTLEIDRTIGDEGDLEPGAANIRMLGVDPGLRQRGAGRALVEECIDRAREAGKRAVTLHTTPLMRLARRMYERMGFERDPARDASYPDVRLIAYRRSLIRAAPG